MRPYADSIIPPHASYYSRRPVYRVISRTNMPQGIVIVVAALLFPYLLSFGEADDIVPTRSRVELSRLQNRTCASHQQLLPFADSPIFLCISGRTIHRACTSPLMRWHNPSLQGGNNYTVPILFPGVPHRLSRRSSYCDLGWDH